MLLKAKLSCALSLRRCNQSTLRHAIERPHESFIFLFRGTESSGGRPEHPRNWAILFGVPSQSGQRIRIQIRYARAQRQGGATDTEALLVLFEGEKVTTASVLSSVGVYPRSLQSKGQRP